MIRSFACLVAVSSFAMLTAQTAPKPPSTQPTPPATTPKIAPPRAPADPGKGNNMLSPEEAKAGWVLLFDGTNPSKSFRSFKKDSFPEGWKVEEGCIVQRDKGGDIITKDQWDNFEFQADWNIAEGGNSGIMWHVTEDGTYPWETGPEMQVLDDAKHADGKNRLTSAGSCYALYAAPEGVVKPAGQWNTARIRCVGTTVQLFLNGTKVVEFDTASDEYKDRLKKSKFAQMPMFGTKSKGHMALQDHGDVVKFRNLKVRPLDAQGNPTVKQS